MGEDIAHNSTEDHFYDDVKAILQSARQNTYRAINSAMVETYWQIGRRIVEQEQSGKDRAGYGDFLIKNLSIKLGDEFGKGFSYANLWNFRRLYLVFPTEEKLYALRRELSWTNIRLIMRLDDPDERDYYIEEAAEQSWSSRVLERNIKSGYYRRILSTKEKVTGSKP